MLVEQQKLVGLIKLYPGWGNVEPTLRSDRAAVGGRDKVPADIVPIDERLALAETGGLDPKRRIELTHLEGRAPPAGG